MKSVFDIEQLFLIENVDARMKYFDRVLNLHSPHGS